MVTIASLLADHVTLRVRSVDRIFLHGYVPRLMTQGLVIRFLLDRGFPIPSPALLGKIGRRYIAAIDRFALDNEIPVVRFKKDDCKEDVAREHFKRAERGGRGGVVLIGVAQEKTKVWRGWRRGGSDSHPQFEFGRQSAMVNHYYFYILDPEWGPRSSRRAATRRSGCGSTSTGTSGPSAKRPGVAFTALDNGFAGCEDPEALQAICDLLGAEQVHEFFARWQQRLPSPLDPEDRRRGYVHQLAFRQLEISDTRVFDRPQAGRAWFEKTITDQLCLGRPDEVSLVFDRKITRATPGRFQTRVITKGVEPAIQIRYKHSKIKQYFKENRALRTETTINDTKDFAVGRSVTDGNWQALLEVGHAANERLLTRELEACPCAPDVATLQRVVLPSTEDGLPHPAAIGMSPKQWSAEPACWRLRSWPSSRAAPARPGHSYVANPIARHDEAERRKRSREPVPSRSGPEARSVRYQTSALTHELIALPAPPGRARGRHSGSTRRLRALADSAAT